MLPESGSFMVEKQQKKKGNSVEFDASLAPSEAEVGDVTKEDQITPKFMYFIPMGKFLLQTVLLVSEEILPNYYSLTLYIYVAMFAFK